MTVTIPKLNELKSKSSAIRRIKEALCRKITLSDYIFDIRSLEPPKPAPQSCIRSRRLRKFGLKAVRAPIG